VLSLQRSDTLTRDDLEILVADQLIEREVALYKVEHHQRHQCAPDRRAVETFREYVTPEAHRRAREALDSLARRGRVATVLSYCVDLTLLGYLASHLVVLINAAWSDVIPPELMTVILNPFNLLACSVLVLVAIVALALKLGRS
jgi:hypothetical protein